MGLMLLARLGFGVFLPLLLLNIYEAIRIAWLLRKVPEPPLQHFLSGHLELITDRTGARRLAQWAHKFNGVVKLRAFWKHVRGLEFCRVQAVFEGMRAVICFAGGAAVTMAGP